MEKNVWIIKKRSLNFPWQKNTHAISVILGLYIGLKKLFDVTDFSFIFIIFFLVFLLLLIKENLVCRSSILMMLPCFWGIWTPPWRMFEQTSQSVVVVTGAAFSHVGLFTGAWEPGGPLPGQELGLSMPLCQWWSVLLVGSMLEGVWDGVTPSLQ